MLSDNTYLSNPKASVLKYKDVLTRLIPKGVQLSELNKAYYLAFLNAQVAGTDKYKSSMEKYGAKYVNILNVNEMRKYVKPIPLYAE